MLQTGLALFTCVEIYGFYNGYVHRRMAGWMYGRMNASMDGWMDESLLYLEVTLLKHVSIGHGDG